MLLTLINPQAGFIFLIQDISSLWILWNTFVLFPWDNTNLKQLCDTVPLVFMLSKTKILEPSRVLLEINHSGEKVSTKAETNPMQ